MQWWAVAHGVLSGELLCWHRSGITNRLVGGFIVYGAHIVTGKICRSLRDCCANRTRRHFSENYNVHRAMDLPYCCLPALLPDTLTEWHTRMSADLPPWNCSVVTTRRDSGVFSRVIASPIWFLHLSLLGQVGPECLSFVYQAEEEACGWMNGCLCGGGLTANQMSRFSALFAGI